MFFPSADFTSCLLFLFLAVSSSLRLCRPLWLRVSSACLCVSVSKCLSVLMSLWVSFSLHVFGYFFPFLGLAVSIYVSFISVSFYSVSLCFCLLLSAYLSFSVSLSLSVSLSASVSHSLSGPVQKPWHRDMGKSGQLQQENTGRAARAGLPEGE